MKKLIALIFLISLGRAFAQEPAPASVSASASTSVAAPTATPAPSPTITPTPAPAAAEPQAAAPAITGSSTAPAAVGVAKAELVNEREIVTRLQIFLDQQNFGPGKIDGRWGEFTGKAVSKYAQCHGLQIGADIYSQLPLDSVYPLYTTYQVTKDDLKWIGPTASKPSEQAKLKQLLYGDLLEFIGERYHSDPDFLRKINPGVNMEKIKPGDVVRVPNVAPFKIENVMALGSLPEIPEFLTRFVVVNRRDRMATLYDGPAETKKMLAAFPITPGSDKLPSPPGHWSIVGIASMPNFRWDDGVLNHGKRTDKFFMLPAGPNNPVGVVWIALSKPGIGMHGTNHPDTIGRAASHGCMRLANWDAVRLAYLVTQKVKVTIE